MKKIILVLGLLVACEQNHTPAESEIVTTQHNSTSAQPQSMNISIDRTINRLPLGDSRITGPLQNEWPIDVEDDLLNQLIASNQEIALIPLTPVSVPRLIVNNEFIPTYASGMRSAYQEYADKDQLYTVLKTIWRTDHLHIVLAGTQELEHEGVSIAQRTDLLVLNEGAIVDGVTLYYSLSESAWGSYQLFYIDENKQIWLQRFVNDEESIQIMESLSLAVLPNGKIRAFKGLAGE